MTTVEERPAPAAAPPPRGPNPVWALLRNSWRQLTSMRTALVLLFLLAVASVPGSTFPQRPVNAEKVTAYYTQHPQLAPVLERLGAFDVYASPWFASIYLLLFTSLVGCVVPRLLDHLRALRTQPPDAPKRLERLPQNVPAFEKGEDPATTAEAIRTTLKASRFRTVLREQGSGVFTVSAEKGFLKESGNLLFHFALLTVLVGFGFGSWYGWHGNRLLVQGPDTGFCNAVTQYDESKLGPRVDASDLPNFCLKLTQFTATYQTTGIPKKFDATVDVKQNGGTWVSRNFTVNEPLRLNRASVHLLGQGYAPILRYTDRFGQSQTNVFPFLPRDQNLTSEGVATFPDANVDPKTGARGKDLQVGFEGVYLPTIGAPGTASSSFPAQNDPGLFLNAYRGDLGVDAGVPGSVYSLDQSQIAVGALKKVSGNQPHELKPGETWTLDDGSKLEFIGTRQFVTISIRYDPTAQLVLAGAVLGLLGLMLSLWGHRRRVWFRVSPLVDGDAGHGGSVVEAGGLPRTDYPGFTEEFDGLVTRVTDEGTSDGRVV